LLGVGGHLIALHRTRVGPFSIDSASTLDQLAELDDPVTLPLMDAVRQAMPVRRIDASQARDLSFGRALTAAGIGGVHGAVHDGAVVALLNEHDGLARPVLVFQPAG
jgi:tRNA pseudouridine55 synthase